jgi:bifunctional DNase/RNase
MDSEVRKQSELKKQIDALRSLAEEQTRIGQLERAAQIRHDELPKLEAQLKQLDAMQQVNGVEVRIRGLMMDPATNMPIVVLKDVVSDAVMPIWVGIFEANAIAIEIEKVAAPRPMSHDLTRNLIQHLNARLEKVVITELKTDGESGGTFLALLWLRQGEEQIAVDARPSDAIALALRADCPIYVAENVMQSAKLNTSGPAEGPTAEQLRGWLENLNDEDLGRYKM